MKKLYTLFFVIPALTLMISVNAFAAAKTYYMPFFWDTHDASGNFIYNDQPGAPVGWWNAFNWLCLMNTSEQRDVKAKIFVYDSNGALMNAPDYTGGIEVVIPPNDIANKTINMYAGYLNWPATGDARGYARVEVPELFNDVTNNGTLRADTIYVHRGGNEEAGFYNRQITAYTVALPSKASRRLTSLALYKNSSYDNDDKPNNQGESFGAVSLCNVDQTSRATVKVTYYDRSTLEIITEETIDLDPNQSRYFVPTAAPDGALYRAMTENGWAGTYYKIKAEVISKSTVISQGPPLSLGAPIEFNSSSHIDDFRMIVGSVVEFRRYTDNFDCYADIMADLDD